MTRRTERISNLIRQEVSDLLRQQINDPRLVSPVSVTKVVTTSDLKYAKVFISTLGDEANESEILEGFTAASGFLRRELGKRLSLRRIPELSFHFDDSIKRGAEVLRLIEQVSSNGAGDKDEH